MSNQKWHLDFTSYWGGFSSDYLKGTGIVILGFHFYSEDIGIIVFNFGFRIVKY